MGLLDDVLARLLGQAQARPDIGATSPVATFAGRVVTPQDKTVADVLQRFPMGTGEGDLPSALQATAGQLALPALQTSSSLLTKALGAALPKALATVAPAAKANPQVAPLLELIRESAPRLYEKVERLPADVHFQVVPHQYMDMAYGTHEAVNPLFHMIRLRETLARSPEHQGLLRDVIGHEMQHALNVNRIAKMAPEDAATIGVLLNDVLRQYGVPHGSLTNRLHEYASKFIAYDPGLAFPNEAGMTPVLRAMPRSWKSLTPEEKAQFTTRAMIQEPMPGIAQKEVRAYGERMPYSDFLKRVLGDEALAHLSESTLTPETRFLEGRAHPLYKLAAQLGVGDVE
jgi:hypothetical protein